MAEKTLGQVAYEQTPSAAWSDWEGQIGAVKVCWQAVADAVIAAHEARRWQAIESAPEGKSLLVGAWLLEKDGSKTWFCPMGTYSKQTATRHGYTHWAPIPAPPQEVECEA